VRSENQTNMKQSIQHNDYHVPVLFHETMEALNIKPSGIYVDCTFGGGGHSAGILKKLNEDGRLYVFDQDKDAQNNVPDDKRVIFIPHNFKHLQRFLRMYKVDKVDGVLADLGVSSHQFDEGSRGFSIRFQGPLDMRMDQRQELTAAKIIAEYSEKQLHLLFEQYGEVTNSKTLAKHIVDQRKQAPFQTIEQFKSLISAVVKGNPNKYFAQVFQALRIEVNDEIGALREMLKQLPDILKSEGRCAIITFHSIEDRVVKNFFRKGTFEEKPDNPFLSEQEDKIFEIITKKPLTAGAEELKLNNRSRSSKLRVAERV